MLKVLIDLLMPWKYLFGSGCGGKNCAEGTKATNPPITSTVTCPPPY